MRCKYTKLFREICSVLQISYVFWVKFAVLCKFLVFLGEICSALQISFCKTDNTFCNLYIREFVFIWFYCPKHPIVFIARNIL